MDFHPLQIKMLYNGYCILYEVHTSEWKRESGICFVKQTHVKQYKHTQNTSMFIFPLRFSRIVQSRIQTKNGRAAFIFLHLYKVCTTNTAWHSIALTSHTLKCASKHRSAAHLIYFGFSTDSCTCVCYCFE